MKVFDLRCARQHGFEGWFASEDDFLSQSARGLVGCPLCGNTDVQRLPSAPRLNLSGTVAVPAAAPQTPDTMPEPADPRSQAQAHWLHAMRRLMERTEDVGPRFAEEARRIHYGEAEERDIRGQASREEAAALAEEGIEVMPLPLPPALKEPLQ